MKKHLQLMIAALLLSTGPALAADYTIDTAHTTVSFKIKHLFSKVMGEFKQFEGTFSYDPANPKAWKAEAVIQAASIDTNVEKRDTHLKSKDFFDTAAYPTITFKSTGVRAVTKTTAKIDGLLTLHGVTKKVTLKAEFLGEDKDPWGNVQIGITATTKVNRKDFGLAWNQVLESGKLLVGEEVEITLDITGLKK
jgi:polyisoprenoid-binding protein YceI